ncbi:MAG: hypothetical protein HY901_06985 [Deltaproteobacteria bacterium]|nr:hypothetical protein [Deltaproteobacteria bacterium]
MPVCRALSLPLVVLVAVAPGAVHAMEGVPQPGKGAELVLLVAPDLAMEPEVRSVTSVCRLVFAYDFALAKLTHFDESRPSSKALAVGGRLAKFLLVDWALVDLAVQAQHEFFGHGWRAREQRLEVSSRFGVPFPYLYLAGPEAGAASRIGARFGAQLVLAEAGGVEANYLAAWQINRDAARRAGQLTLGQLDLYLWEKLYYSAAYFGNPNWRANDLIAYRASLLSLWGGRTGASPESIFEHLELAHLWNYADPTLWSLVYHLLVSHLWHGEREMALPVLRWNGFWGWPASRFNLSPFGAEHYLDLFAGHGEEWVDLYLRVGSSGLARYWGGGLHAKGVRFAGRLVLGAEVDLWDQPAWRGEFGPGAPNNAGINFALDAAVEIGLGLGLTGKLAYKTPGYLMGQPMAEGVYGYLGVIAPAPESWPWPEHAGVP